MSPTLTVDPAAVREVRRNGSAARLVVADCTDRGAGLAALALALDDLYGIPHPAEADDPLPNFATVDDTDDGPQLWFDIKDEGPVYAEQIVELVATRLRAGGVGGTLRPAARDEEPEDEDEDGDDDGEPADTGGVRWSMESPPGGWPADLAVVAGAGPATVLGFGAGGRAWAVAHWERSEPGHATDVAAALADGGWQVAETEADAPDLADPDRWGPFSDPRTRRGARTHGLRVWRATRAGRVVVVSSVATDGGWVIRAAIPAADAPDVAMTRPGRSQQAPWPVGFPSDLPPIVDAVHPPTSATAPGMDGLEWLQVQWLRRRDDHATDVADALTRDGWRLERADERALTAMQAHAQGIRGGLGTDDVRGWNAYRAANERLFLISLPVPGAGALLLVSTPST